MVGVWGLGHEARTGSTGCPFRELASVPWNINYDKGGSEIPTESSHLYTAILWSVLVVTRLLPNILGSTDINTIARILKIWYQCCALKRASANHIVVVHMLAYVHDNVALQKCTNCRSTMKLVGPIHFVAGSQAHGSPAGDEQLEPQDSSTDCAMVFMARDRIVLLCDVCVYTDGAWFGRKIEGVGI